MLLSLLLHGALGLLLWRARPPSLESPAEVREPLLLEFTEHEAPRAAPVAERPAVPPRETPRRPPQPSPARKPASAAAPAPALEPVASGPPSGPEAPAIPQEPDVPRAVRLFPGPGGLPVEQGSAAADVPRGHTWRPGEGPSPEQRLAEERERVRGRVQGFLDDGLATARVENGLVDTYFGQMDHALEKGLTGASLFDYQGVLRHFFPALNLRELMEGAARYGATGNPDDAAGGPLGTDRLEDVARSGTAGARARRARDTLGELDRSVAGANTLSVELELEQSPTGQLLGVKLLRGSGNPLFDTYVLDKVPPSLAALGPASENFAARSRAPTVRSVWNVEGHVSFSRTIKLSKLHTLDAADAAYVSALLATNLLGGSFDETRGEVTIVDVRRPHFDIRTQLLRVY
ncbi:hypothetical protein F0U62_25535 [Cystobacter fuscus]|uniref:hypothetical protein n=1 Tax=Cystobacter fuscus TaxID=43 RepID=UPI002B2F835E|nr:hypothetical protein F0U62_25535 [Cystobacter fuscus]